VIDTGITGRKREQKAARKALAEAEAVDLSYQLLQIKMAAIEEAAEVDHLRELKAAPDCIVEYTDGVSSMSTHLLSEDGRIRQMNRVVWWHDDMYWRSILPQLIALCDVM